MQRVPQRRIRETRNIAVIMRAGRSSIASALRQVASISAMVPFGAIARRGRARPTQMRPISQPRQQRGREPHRHGHSLLGSADAI